VATLNDIHVLVVDDNKQMRFLVRCLLRAGGITKVTEAETGAQAFEVMRARPVDLIIVDWKMAPVDGLAFTYMVRRNHDSPNVAAARDAGVSGFVKKPISARLLFDRISNVLTDTRLFVRTETFFGPDRRFGQDPHYAGPMRREADRGEASTEAVDLDDLRWTA
jgi:two-component system, chemotaxis family, chemotaxis protein CheY